MWAFRHAALLLLCLHPGDALVPRAYDGLADVSLPAEDLVESINQIVRREEVPVPIVAE